MPDYLGWLGPAAAFLILLFKAVTSALAARQPTAPLPSDDLPPVSLPPASPDAPPAPTSPAPVQSSQPLPKAPDGPLIAPDGLTARGCAELVFHEAIVCEAYRDSQGVWTWSVGVTDASGHSVERYIDHPAPLSECLAVFVWLLRTKYLPDVLKAFAGHALSEAELAAALSFHYNTGAILAATWLDHWKAGDTDGAKTAFMLWDKPASILGRRQEECDLFFGGKWSGDGKASVYPVLKPSYQPDFRHGTRIDVLTPLQALLGTTTPQA